MTAMMSGIVLVSASGLVALSCVALAIALVRVSGRPPASGASARSGRKGEE